MSAETPNAAISFPGRAADSARHLAIELKPETTTANANRRPQPADGSGEAGGPSPRMPARSGFAE